MSRARAAFELLALFSILGRLERRGVTSADCVLLTWLGAGLLVVYQVWIALGLPLGSLG